MQATLRLISSSHVLGSRRAGYLLSASITSLARRRRRCCRRRLLSTSSITRRPIVADEGAWTVLAALEKAKEARGVKIARLVDALEALLPRDHDDDLDGELLASTQQQHTKQQRGTSDPAFFSLPETSIAMMMDANTERMNITGEDVRRLLQATRQGRRVDLHTIEALVKEATKHFKAQPRLVSLAPLRDNQQLTVIGDLHGSLSDLEAILGLTGEPSPNNILLFNGDLADRGDHGIEVIVVVCALFLAYPEFVYVNRGNHEDYSLMYTYGLAAELQHKYGASVFRTRLSPKLDVLFRSLPLATVVEKDALIVHAGPPPPGVRLADICKFIKHDRRGLARTIRTNTELDWEHKKAHDVIEALLWSDPITDEDKTGGAILADFRGQIRENEMLGWVPNVSRGAGYKFDAGMVRNLLQSEGLSRLIRSHEPVHRGCVRYVIRDDASSTNASRKMEFFTVFSASRYPYKEGFNQGALLKLHSNGKHSVLRYATEEDEPLVGSSFTSFDEETAMSSMCAVDPLSIRRALKKAAVSYQSELRASLEQLAKLYPNGIPFDQVVDVLIQTLKLDEPDLKKPSARMALARAMSIQCQDTPPKTIGVLKCIDSFLGDECDDDYVREMAPYYPWLRAVFEMVDKNHDGSISQSEWLDAVCRINSSIPAKTKPINAEDTWQLLDVNGDGHVSLAEWDQLGRTLSR